MSAAQIALIDDEPQIIEALTRLLKPKHDIISFTNPLEFLEHLKKFPELKLSVIVTDQKMPELTGAELLEKSLQWQPSAIRILLTGYSDLETIVEAVNKGQIYRYLHKPWDPTDFANTIEEAVTKYELISQVKTKTQELEQANKALKDLDTTKNQFMVLINHELKTPLTGIMSYSELLSETHLTEDQQLYLNHIKKNADRLKKMIQDSLLIVAAESKTLPFKMEKFISSQLDLRLSDTFENLRQKKQIQIQSQLPKETLLGDPHLLSQALRRLLENAIRFGKEESLVKIDHKVLPHHQIEFSILNEGPPFEAETLANIGKPFYIAEDIMKHSQGTGLGLSVVTSLLKLHNSHLKIKNNSSYVEVSFVIRFLN